MTVHANRDTLPGMPRSTLALLLFLAVVLGACGSDEDSASNRSQKASAPPAPTVKLIDAGATPRKRLRYTVQPGDRTSSALILKLGLEQTLDGQRLPSQPAPAVKMRFVTEVLKATGSATTVRFTYGKSEAIAERGISPSVAEEIESSLASLEGTQGTIVIAPTGAVLDATFENPASPDPELRALTNQLTEQARSLATPLPSEPVGVGARWKARSELKLDGLVADQTQTFMLERIQGDDYEFALRLDQVFGPTELPGGDARIVGGRVTGTGTMSGSLRALVPRRSQLTGEGGMELAVSTGEGTKQTLEQEIGVVASLATKRLPSR